MTNKLYQEDINTLSVDIFDWVEHNFGNLTEEQTKEFFEIFDNFSEPFSNGYQNYN